MGQAKYKYLHTWPATDTADRPTMVDAMGIWFPNSRSYAYVDMAPAKTGQSDVNALWHERVEPTIVKNPNEQ